MVLVTTVNLVGKLQAVDLDVIKLMFLLSKPSVILDKLNCEMKLVSSVLGIREPKMEEPHVVQINATQIKFSFLMVLARNAHQTKYPLTNGTVAPSPANTTNT